MSLKSGFLVFAQFACFAFFMLDGHLIASSYLMYFQILAFILALWGVVVMKRFNIQPEVKQTAQLVQKGPYKYLRNPMYSGIILFLSLSIYTHFGLLRLVILFLLIIVLVAKIILEEQFLTHKFGNSYLLYKTKTFRLLPFVF